MISCNRGLEYHIILDKEYDYFDIIPDLEKLTKHHIILEKNIIKVILTKNTDSRLLKSNYYLERKNNWFDFNLAHCYKINDSPIQLIDNEKQIINIIEDNLNDKITDKGWFDVAYYY